MFASPVRKCESCPVGMAHTTRCAFTPTFLPERAILCEPGEHMPNVYFVREGALGLQAPGAGGGEPTLAVRGPRSLLCMEGLQGLGSPFQVRALTDAWLCSAPLTGMRQLMGLEGSPERIVAEMLVSEVVRAQQDLCGDGSTSLIRVARYLLSRSAEPTRSGELEKRTMAQMLGMRAETFSRCLRRLAEQGLVEHRRGVRILDEAGLAALARGDTLSPSSAPRGAPPAPARPAPAPPPPPGGKPPA
jgi:CRP/FNR family transcriptional regulator, cyclic AMP receptor protein